MLNQAGGPGKHYVNTASAEILRGCCLTPQSCRRAAEQLDLLQTKLSETVKAI